MEEHVCMCVCVCVYVCACVHVCASVVVLTLYEWILFSFFLYLFAVSLLSQSCLCRSLRDDLQIKQLTSVHYYDDFFLTLLWF